jgi:hypothetical protein
VHCVALGALVEFCAEIANVLFATNMDCVLKEVNI